jgi:geranylgeranyl pyrophosphate synthase
VKPVALETSAAAWLAHARTWTDAALEVELRALADAPPRIVEAMSYALLGGGKRVRPALVRLFAHAHGAGDEHARSAAVAIECVHTYSLVHDDLPCMDDDDLRRGRPTCHKVFGEALAVLAGDALLTWSFELVARERAGAELASVLARAAGARGMVGGQVLDLESAGARTTAADVARIHAGKTAALLGAACELGAVCADAGAADRTRARTYGELLGRCFQAVDDVLDVTAASSTLGKTAGKDARQAKPSLVAAVGLAGAQAEARRLSGEAHAAARAVGTPHAALLVALVDALLERES